MIELHDCFSANEMITYEALGLCPEGQAGKLIDEGAVTYGGKWVEPIRRADLQGPPTGCDRPGAVFRVDMAASWQGRQAAGPRREGRPPAQHRPGGAVVVTMYRKGFPA